MAELDVIFRGGGPLDGERHSVELGDDGSLPPIRVGVGAYWPGFAADGPSEGIGPELDAQGRPVYLWVGRAGLPKWLRPEVAGEGNWPRMPFR